MVIVCTAIASWSLRHLPSVSAAFTLDGMTAEPVIISTLDKTGADAVLNAPK